MIFRAAIFDGSGRWECGLAYSRDKEMVAPVMTAVAEQEISFVRQDLLLCNVHTPPCYVSTISHLVVGVVVSVMDQLGFAPLRGDKL